MNWNIKIYKNRIVEKKKIVCFIAVLGTSMLGVSICGLSINKVSLIPLFLLLIFSVKSTNCYFSKISLVYFFYLLFQTVSCMRAFLIPGMDNYPKYYTSLIYQIIQNILIYLPMFLFVNTLCEDDKQEWLMYIKVSIRDVCILQCIWLYLELVSYYFFHININELIFNDLLNGIVKGISYYTDYSSGTGVIRMAGLGHDPAYLGYILVLGIVVEKKWMRKFFFLFSTMIVFSRTGVVVGLFVIIYQFLHENSGVNIKEILRFSFIAIIIVIFFIVIYRHVDVIKEHINHLIFRLNLKRRNISNSMHMGFIYFLPQIYFRDLNIVEKIIGLGSRVEGLATIRSLEYKWLLNSRQTISHAARPVECDIAGVLLSNGILGFITYYGTLIRLSINLRENDKIIILAIFLFGIMYNAANNTMTYLLLIFFTALNLTQKDMAIKN